MVIFIGGLIGTGKSSLAKALANKLDAYYFDIDEVKKRIYPTDPKYAYNLKNNIPFSDETRKKTFESVVLDFALLSKKHSLIVVDETLHKEKLRQILFEGAKKQFGSYILIWVKANEAVIKKRFEEKSRENHMLKNPFEMYLSLKNEFEPFKNPNLIFINNKPYEESVVDFCDSVHNLLKSQ